MEPPLFSRLRPLITSLVSLSQVSLCPFPRLPVFITSCLPVLLSHFPMPVSHLPACLPSLFLPSPCISVSLFSVSRLNACLPACLPSPCLSPCIFESLSPCLTVSRLHACLPRLPVCLRVPFLRSPSLPVSLSPYLSVSLCPCLPVSLSLCVPVSLSSCSLVSLSLCVPVSRIPSPASPYLSPLETQQAGGGRRRWIMSLTNRRDIS